tara:strand:+ start:119 stop:682 length:564 start_codon:yes stop_codon:yes gene_type:complete
VNINLVTSNLGKVEELTYILKPFGHKVSQLKVECPEIQASTLEEVVDFGLDWLGAKKIQTPFIIDDAGIFVEALENFPGVYSRYVYDTIGLQGILKQMESIVDRVTRFKCVLGLMLEDGSKHKFVGECKGNLIHEMRGTGGFGYDPIFIPDGYTKTFSELLPEEKNDVSHRGRAMHKLVDFLSKLEN